MLLLVLAARSSHLFFLELFTSFAARKVWSCSARALLVGAYSTVLKLVPGQCSEFSTCVIPELMAAGAVMVSVVQKLSW